jgi:hypothetical protein
MFRTALIALAFSLALTACASEHAQNAPAQSPRHVSDTHAEAPWHVPVVSGAAPPVWPEDKTSEQPP